MAIIDVEEVLGYFLGSELVCCDCIRDDEGNKAKSDEILTNERVNQGDKYFFCDRCKEEILPL